MRKKRIIIVLGVFLVAIGGAMPLMGAESTLKVGCTLPLNVGMGIETKKCLEVIVPAFNKEGGLVVKGKKYKIDLTIYDDKYKADAGRSAVERLVHKDKVKFMVCQIGSAPTLAGLAVTEPEKVLTFCGGASRKLLSPNLKYVFRTSIIGAVDPAVFGYTVKKYPGKKTLVTIAPDDESGRGQSRKQKKIAEALGLTVKESLYYPRKTTDFTPIGTKVKALNPDLVTFPATAAGTQFGLQLKGLYEAGWQGIKFQPTAPKMGEVMSVAPKEAIEGLITSIKPTELADPPPAAKKLKELYINKYGSWSQAGVAWIGGWYVLMEAIRKAESLDPDAVAAAVSGLEIQTPLGYARMVKRPDLKNDRCVEFMPELYIAEVKDGKLIHVTTVPWEQGLSSCEKIYGGEWR